jgi:hypothetical protein
MPSFRNELQARIDAKQRPTALTVVPDPPAITEPAIEPLITITPGPRNARTDPESGLRFYTWQGRELPSVTTIRRMAGIPHGLHQWTISQVILRAVSQHDELTAMLTRERRPRERVLEKNRMEEAGKWLRRAATEERDAAAALGTAVHDAAAEGLDPDTVDPAVRPRLLQFRDWVATAKPWILGTEFQTWNLTEGYAGTADLLVRLLDGSVWLIDLKTGKSTFSEHLLQLMGYLMAEFVGADDVVDQRLTGLLRQVTGIAVLHLADDHWEFRPLEATPEAWAAQRGLLAFSMWLHAHPDIDDVTVATSRGSEERS